MPWCWIQALEHPKGEIPREIRDLIPAEGMGGCSFIRDTGRGQGWVERAQTLPSWAGPVGGEASSSHSLFPPRNSCSTSSPCFRYRGGVYSQQTGASCLIPARQSSPRRAPANIHALREICWEYLRFPSGASARGSDSLCLISGYRGSLICTDLRGMSGSFSELLFLAAPSSLLGSSWCLLKCWTIISP